MSLRATWGTEPDIPLANIVDERVKFDIISGLIIERDLKEIVEFILKNLTEVDVANVTEAIAKYAEIVTSGRCAELHFTREGIYAPMLKILYEIRELGCEAGQRDAKALIV